MHSRMLVACFRGRTSCTAVAIAAFWPITVLAEGGWVNFHDETSTRLIASDPSLGLNDTEEKDFAIGDVDHDGDDDLVVVRKQIGNSPGKRVNVLFLNENGVLTDRT
ncbi:MAG: hypothetical protein IID36_11900, partial [Planctomycetes bacterium]|nr:hypothetical protein [Planctomycetota bacterium]